MGNFVFCNLVIVSTVEWTNGYLGVITCPAGYKPIDKEFDLVAMTNSTGTYTPIICFVNSAATDNQIGFDFAKLPGAKLANGAWIWCQLFYRYK